MLDDREWFRLCVHGLQGVPGINARGGGSVKLGQTPQSAPDPALRSAFEQYATVATQRDEHEHAARAPGTFCAAACWKLTLPTGCLGEAPFGQRAVSTQRFVPGTNGCSQVHDCLRIYVYGLVRSPGIRQLPQTVR